jgi:hypothetical protein
MASSCQLRPFLLYLDTTTQVTKCVGDGNTFVLNCTVNSSAHAWIIPPFRSTSVSRARQQAQLQQFTLNLVANTSNTSITSSLTGVAFDQLSGTVASCSDGLLPDGQGEVQETTIITLTAGKATLT